MMAFFKGFESFPSIAVGNVVQFTKPLLFQIFRISFTRSATPPKVIDYSFNPLIKRATTFLFSQFHKFFLNVLSNIPYVKLIQDVLQEFSHIGLNLFVSICCNTTNFDTILVRERCGSLEYDQIDCTITKQMDFRLFFCTFKQQCSISCINPMNTRIKELLLDGIECRLTDKSTLVTFIIYFMR